MVAVSFCDLLSFPISYSLTLQNAKKSSWTHIVNCLNTVYCVNFAHIAALFAQFDFCIWVLNDQLSCQHVERY